MFAYLLWLCGSFVGLHHFYLGRDLQCFLWIVTGGGFGFGVIRDFWRIPEYCDAANQNEAYTEILKVKAKSQNAPSLTAPRLLGQICVGLWFGWVFSGIPPAESPLFMFSLCTSIGTALGVYASGSSVTEQEGDFKITAAGALVGGVLDSFSEGGKMAAFLACAAFTLKGRKYKRTSRKSSGCCKRALKVALLCGLFGSVMILGVLNHGKISVTDEDGTTRPVPIRECIQNVLKSPVWGKVSLLVRQFIKDLNTMDWWSAFSKGFNEFIEEMDVEGESSAIEVLDPDKTHGLTQASSFAEIKKAYRAQSKKWHPDKNPGKEAEATKRMAEINEAYETLTKVDSRRRTSSADQQPHTHVEL
jgi:hypothetical protein